MASLHYSGCEGSDDMSDVMIIESNCIIVTLCCECLDLFLQLLSCAVLFEHL